jgi:hypothetical protein
VHPNPKKMSSDPQHWPVLPTHPALRGGGGEEEDAFFCSIEKFLMKHIATEVFIERAVAPQKYASFELENQGDH